VRDAQLAEAVGIGQIRHRIHLVRREVARRNAVFLSDSVTDA